VKMASRKVLTVNQVVDIMLRWLQTKDWEKAFLQVIPSRKLPKPAAEGGNESANLESSETDKANSPGGEAVSDSDYDEGEVNPREIST